MLLLRVGYTQDSGLDPQKRLSQYVLTHWSTEDGLASESTNELLQSNDGYIWIATYTGLHRFDGSDFNVFTTENSQIPAVNVLRVEKGKNGELWVGSLHGVSKYVGKKFEIPPNLSSLISQSIEDMLVTDEGHLWISTKSNELYYYDGDTLINYTLKLDLEESTVLSIENDTNGNVFFGTDDSQLIGLTQMGKIKRFSLPSEANGIITLYANKNALYLGTGRGLYVLQGDTLKKVPLLPNNTVNSIIIDQKDILWLGTQTGLYRYQPSVQKLDSLTEETGMPNNIVRDMAFDRDGNLWVGTYRNGIFLLSDGSITSYTRDDGLSSNIISSVTELRKNEFLFGNENGQLNLLKDGNITRYTPPIPLPSTRLKNLFTDSKARVWISTYGGLFIIDGDRGYKYTINNGFPDNFVRIAFEDSNGIMWVGTKNAGLIRFESLSDWEVISNKDGLSSNYIMSIEENSKGQLIVGTMSGLNILEGKEVIKTVKVEDGLPSNFMFTTFSTENYIWTGSHDGLTGYSEKEIVNLTVEDGLPSNLVYDMVLDQEGTIWIPSENSIWSVKLSELERAAIEKKKLSFKQFDKSHGMKNSHCLGAVHSYKDSNGNIWVPTLGGIVMINPKEVNPLRSKPTLAIEHISANGIPVEVENQVTIPARTDRLLIDFTAISFTQSRNIRFRYKLEPFDGDWVEASEERNAIYTNLSPGSYTFRLQAGVGNSYFDEELVKAIEIKAAWTQTFWAKILLFVGVVGVVLLIYWIRLRTLTSMNKRLDRIVKERTFELEQQKRELGEAIEKLKSAQEQMIQSDKMASLGILAAGVAHEINNPLNFIQGGVDGLEQTLRTNENVQKEEYETLMKAIKEGISRAATIVSSLNEFSHASDKQQEPLDIHHMIENCLTMVQYRLKKGIEVQKDFTDKPVIIQGNNGKIHQALLNIITNAMQAIKEDGFIRLTTKVEGNNVVIEVIDSGHGIKPEDLPKITEPFFSTKDPGKGTGLGLSITYSIIQEHEGTLTFSSTVGKGTTVRITLPLKK
ncbi:MAG: hypothetical protein Tsb0034_11320 [Ekhidna sp.]